MGEIIYLPTPKELSPEQREHWEHQLEVSQRAAENAMRMLGYFAIEKGIE